ncbi:hypothetical protein F4808DRAFT_133102 [Astrocystis sublimbata]|nr:hypothetical protein F4808DRAFT_133102 [Astrocystis sublimbata]
MLLENDTAGQDGETLKAPKGVEEIHLVQGSGRDLPLVTKRKGELECRRGLTPKTIFLDQVQGKISPRIAAPSPHNSNVNVLDSMRLREGASIPGLLRTIGTENPAGRFISVGISDGNFDAATYDSEGLVRCISDQFYSPMMNTRKTGRVLKAPGSTTKNTSGKMAVCG